MSAECPQNVSFLYSRTRPEVARWTGSSPKIRSGQVMSVLADEHPNHLPSSRSFNHRLSPQLQWYQGPSPLAAAASTIYGGHQTSSLSET
ncbi:hypothetical protein CSOJ01_01155 [Colletotrichum sojae]|uniref:Uncharacterized protein n=1 Tax=Colletotrichum sojae TaxID=2175907 RepID=A0A8H6JVG4_9PEZI|nr:hypothetical protein CSOJ01_01155 [Colletotrichum sojae]